MFLSRSSFSRGISLLRVVATFEQTRGVTLHDSESRDRWCSADDFLCDPVRIGRSWFRTYSLDLLSLVSSLVSLVSQKRIGHIHDVGFYIISISFSGFPSASSPWEFLSRTPQRGWTWVAAKARPASTWHDRVVPRSQGWICPPATSNVPRSFLPTVDASLKWGGPLSHRIIEMMGFLGYPWENHRKP